MLCPYRINQEVTQRYKDHQCQKPYFDIRQTFAKCEGRDCPYFLGWEESESGEDECLKVKIMVTSIKDISQPDHASE